MNTFKVIFTVSCLMVLTACGMTEKNMIANNCDIVIYNSYSEIKEKNPGELPIMESMWGTYTGYSLNPFGSKEEAFLQAKSKVCELGTPNTFYKSFSGEKNLSGSNVPKGYFIGGNYNVYSLKPIKLAEESEDLVINGLINWLVLNREISLSMQHLNHLLELSKNKAYTKVPKVIEDIVSKQSNNRFGALTFTKLLSAYSSHKGSASKAKLLSWAKHHSDKDIRLASLLSLVDDGYREDVEGIIEKETDLYVLSNIKKKLI